MNKAKMFAAAVLVLLSALLLFLLTSPAGVEHAADRQTRTPERETRTPEKTRDRVGSAGLSGFPSPDQEDEGEMSARLTALKRARVWDSGSTVIVIEGIVLNSYDRRPVTHARVSFSTASAGFAAVSTRVNRKGAFRAQLPRAESYVIRAKAEGFRDYTNSGFSALTRDHASTQILMDPIHILKGRVLDTERRPVANALVLMMYQGEQSSSNGRSNNTRTDASGQFETQLYAGKWLVSATHPWLLSEGSVTVSLPEEDYVTLYMREPKEDGFGRIVGRVVDSEGSPVPGANVSLRDLETKGSVGGVWADPGGRFSFDRVREGRYQLMPSAKGYVLPKDPPEIRVEANRESFVELILPKGVPVEGIVLNEAKSPIDQALVLLGDRNSGRRGARTDPDGRFRLADIEPGQYQIEAGHRDYRTYRGELLVAEQEWLTLVLKEGLTFQGILTTVDGSPVERFTLWFLDPSRKRWPLKSGQFSAVGGRFVVRGLEPGTYRLEVMAGDQEPVGIMLQLQKSLEALLVIDPSNQKSPLRIFPAGH